MCIEKVQHDTQEKHEDMNDHSIGTIYQNFGMVNLHTKQCQKSLKYFQHSLMMQRKLIEIEQDNDDDDGNNCYPMIILLSSKIGMIHCALKITIYHYQHLVMC